MGQQAEGRTPVPGDGYTGSLDLVLDHIALVMVKLFQSQREAQLEGYLRGWTRMSNAKIEDRLSRLWNRCLMINKIYL